MYLLFAFNNFCKNYIILNNSSVRLVMILCKNYHILPPTGGLRFFFALRALQFWAMALVFHYYLEKFGLNIFPDLKSKQLNMKIYLKN